MPSSAKCCAKRAPSPASAECVKSFRSFANSSRVMPPPIFFWERLAQLRIWQAALDAADILRRGLFRGLRHDQPGLARKPAVNEAAEPGALGEIIYRAIGKMLMPRPRARRIHVV